MIHPIAIGLQTKNDARLLGPVFERLWRAEQADDFNPLLDAINDASLRHQWRSRLERFHQMLERDARY